MTAPAGDGARAAGIVDAGAAGAPRPLAELLARAAARRTQVVVAAAADGAPLVASARRLAAAEPAALLHGLRVAMAATGAPRGLIAVEARAAELVRALEPELPEGGAVAIAAVPDVAGCGDPAELCRDAAGVSVPPGADPLDHGVLVVSAAALCDLAAAPRQPVVDRVVTVAGDVLRPGVRRVPVGTAIEDLVAAAGGASCGPAWLALGDGPLDGRPLGRDDVVGKTTRAVTVVAGGSDLARRARVALGDQVRRSLSACEGCAMCSEVCPPRLLGAPLRPHELVRALSGHAVSWERLAAARHCTGCALCDVACPSGLSPRGLVAAIVRAVADRAAAAPADLAAAAPHPERDARRLSIALVALRLGLEGRDLAPPWDPAPVLPERVAIPFGASARGAAWPVVAAGARVRRGELVAAPDEGRPGVAMHASIDGGVAEIAGGAVVIERARA